ncbi:ZinT/AdcA family metal-binding protein [Rossellomorea vietnamensis]|uniref:ZinT/AdcA family metal-binding protein n=1 Tax=Rossellomorea vietnamensis TaxID=218284 RepID=A0A5D4MCH9_9BACI|nr:ZinT/AdcA family metal-binding protein [Rossellomorea vietnamensis]TYR99356.1 ZinT/AdcA family metal-binding protein [Rossellomorea vietnamensis]
MFKKVAGALSLSALILGAAACGNENTNGNEVNSETNESLKVYTTVYPLEYFTEQIAGDEADVESILPPGSNPHNYEPTTDDMMKIAESDAFIYNGSGLELYAEKISEAVKSEKVKLIEASKGLELINHSHDHDHEKEHEDGHEQEEDGTHEDEHEEHEHGDKDPHIWLDPIRSIELAENIKETLVEIRPEQEDTFNKNFEELKRSLEELDQEFHTEIESLPENKIIVSHAAYGYWEKAYGIEQIAVSGLSPDNEPSQKELQTIIETAEEYGLKYVLFEQNVTPRVAEIVRKEIGAEALRIHNLSVLTEEDVKNDEDYLSLMHQNLEVLSEALSIPSDISGNEHTHDHDHAHNEETEEIYKGHFEDSQVRDRALSDWEGDWQSVYPYLQDGTLDEVFAHKAEQDGEKTALEYKNYYEVGYETDVDRILFEGNKVTFFKNGKESSGEYVYDGYEILTYEAGNRGVRFIYKLDGEAEGMPDYIQFSDHSIYPTKADHYHLYWGDDRKALLDEVTNWPTFYPSDMSGKEIADEMMAH